MRSFEYAAAYAARAGAFLREFVFPSGCALCGKTLMNADEAACGLCDECAGLFRLDGEERCSRCGKPLISERERCAGCKTEPEWRFDAALALFPYIGANRALLKAYKFDKRKPLAGFLAEKLLEARTLLPAESRDALWVPVPPRRGKLKKEMWDQIEVIARILERRGRREGGLVVRRCLERERSRSQKELNRAQRGTNLKGKIRAREPPPRRAVLVDDVFTTGATLSECAGVLKAAGAEKVWGICLFYD